MARCRSYPISLTCAIVAALTGCGTVTEFTGEVVKQDKNFVVRALVPPPSPLPAPRAAGEKGLVTIVGFEAGGGCELELTAAFARNGAQLLLTVTASHSLRLCLAATAGEFTGTFDRLAPGSYRIELRILGPDQGQEQRYDLGTVTVR